MYKGAGYTECLLCVYHWGLEICSSHQGFFFFHRCLILVIPCSGILIVNFNQGQMPLTGYHLILAYQTRLWECSVSSIGN